MRVGVIADTHDQLPCEVMDLFQGVDHIIHAGDICGPEVICALQTMAPTTVVRGNNDLMPDVAGLPAMCDLELAGHRVRVIHDVEELCGDPCAEGVVCVVSGHSHQPQNRRVGATLYFNPGAAGPRRRGRPRSVGILTLGSGGIAGEVLEFVAAQDRACRG
jgi:putative phosphoesterase